MAENRLTSPREDALRKYFREIPKLPDHRIANQWFVGGCALSALSLVFWLFAASDSGRFILGTALVLAGIFSVSKGLLGRSRELAAYRRALSLATPKPSNVEVDRWLGEGLNRIRFHSLDRLGLTQEECEPMELPPLKAPVLWYKPGIDLQDIVWHTGADGIARYGIYNVTFLWLAKLHVGIFQCDYDLLRDVVLNEEMREFYYQDIVSVSTREESSALTLPTGSSLTSVQEFRIVVSGDQLFKVVVGAKQIRTLTGAERIPEEADAETVVRRLRVKIKETKIAALN